MKRHKDCLTVKNAHIRKDPTEPMFYHTMFYVILNITFQQKMIHHLNALWKCMKSDYGQ